jgi:hypothetical protein
MAEYAGFQEREGTDFAKSINDLSTVVSGLETKVKDIRKSDKKLMTDNDALLDAHKPFAYQDANDYIATSIPSIRAYQYDLYKKLNNREITPSDYRTAMQNQKTDWDNKLGLIKTYDDFTLEVEKRLQPGPNGENPIGSSKDVQMFQNRMKFYTDLKTKKMFISPSGKLADASVDKDGKIIEGSIFDMKAQMNINNIASNRFSLRDALQKDTKVLGAYSKFEAFKDGSTELIEATKNSPEFIAAKTDIIGQYVNNDETVGHILTDNSDEGYLTYSFPEQKEKIITDKINTVRLVNGIVDEAAVRKEMEAKLIHLKSDDNGVFGYVITPEMRTKAKDIVEKQLLSQLGYTEKGTAMKNMSSRGGGLTEQQKITKGDKEDLNYDVYVGSTNAFVNGDFSAYDTDTYLFKRVFNSKGKPNILVYQRNKPGESDLVTQALIDKGKLEPINTLKLPNQAPQFLRFDTGTSPYTTNDYYEGKNLFQQRNGRLNFSTEQDYRDTRTTPAPAKTVAPAETAGPKVGQIDGGYRFKGGDASNPKNWEKVK